jgi:ABC-type branched-subunit amino acid transport system ATPase component
MTNSAFEPDTAGARKTTLFHLITGQPKPHGNLIFDGREITRRARLGPGRTFQVLTLFPSLRPYEHFLLATRTHIRRSLRGPRPDHRVQTLVSLRDTGTTIGVG